MKETSYFAPDGNYGSAEGLLLLETTYWSEDDWLAIEEAGDFSRTQVAQDIATSYSRAEKIHDLADGILEAIRNQKEG